MHMQRERESERASRGLWSSAEIIVLFYDADLKIKLPTDPLLCGRSRLLLPLIRRWCGLVYGSCGYKWRYGNQRQRWRRDIDDDGPRGWVLISCVTMLRGGSDTRSIIYTIFTLYTIFNWSYLYEHLCSITMNLVYIQFYRSTKMQFIIKVIIIIIVIWEIKLLVLLHHKIINKNIRILTLLQLCCNMVTGWICLGQK